MSNTFLSKSSFLKGLQCHKFLWLYKNSPELMDPVDDHQKTVFSTGHTVGELATLLFPGGKMVPCDELTYHQQVDVTRELMEQGQKTIFEAAFSVQGVFARVDILHKGSEGWELYEVKSSVRIKDLYVHDIALQTWVLKQTGLNISKCGLVVLNRNYRRRGNIDIKQLFVIHDLTPSVTALQPDVQTEVNSLQNMLRGSEPMIPIGAHCENPYRCSFYTHCHGEIVEDSVFKLADIGSPNPYELFHNGLRKFSDLDLKQLKWRQRQQVESFVNKINHVNSEEVKNFLGTLWYPLCYLDFETTYMVAVPIFDGTSPYQQIPFQFSLHIQREYGGPVEHVEFLAEPGLDPRPELMERLFSAIPKGACVLAYNKVFEKRCLREAVQDYPEYVGQAQAVSSNMRDLMVPFRNKHVYYWSMNGSYSLKKVLPALLPEMSYEGLPIADGTAAASAYLKMHEIQNPEEVNDLRQALLKYCKLDTYAMVKLIEKLHTLAG